MSKRIFITVIVILVVLLLGLAAVFFFTRDKGEMMDQETDSANQEQVIPDTSFRSQPRVLVSEETISPILSFSGDSLWYFTPDGMLWQQDIYQDSRQQYFLFNESGSQSIDGLEEAFWQPNGSDFIVQQNVLGEDNYQVYEANELRLIDYPAQLTKPIFTADGTKIVYDWVNGDGTHQLKVSDENSENFRTVTDLFRPDYQIVASPIKQEVALFVDSQIEPSKIFLVDLESGEFTDIGEAAAYEGVKFSPDGTKLLAARRDETAGALDLVMFNLSTGQTLSLGIEGSAAQAAWSQDSEGIFVVTRFGVLEYDTRDNFFDIIFDFEGGQFVPQEVLLHPDEQVVLFVDGPTGFIYRVDL